jgi:hypothetical protein
MQIPGKKFFLPTLVSIMKSSQQGLPYRMDMVLHVKDNPALMQNRDPKKLGQVLSRGARFADQLQKSGLPQKLIGVGIEEGDVNTIDIVFRPHEPFTPIEPKAPVKE